MKTFAISIPKPCHEDWNKMTPDAKGAFCGSCQKSVYDFSTKTDEEIISVFEKEGDAKVCGRFSPAQLSRPVISFGEVNSTKRLAQFLYALVLVFGASLFSGTAAFGQQVKGECTKIMGKMSVNPIKPQTEIVKDTVVKVDSTASIIKNVELMPLGQAFVRGVYPLDKVVGDTVITDKPLTIGVDTLSWIEEDMPNLTIDTVVPMKDIDTIPFETVPTQLLVAGGISFVQITNIITPIDTVEEDMVPVEDITEEQLTIIPENVILPPSSLDLIVSPNPSSGEIILSYTLKNDNSVRIDLYDNSGKLVRTLTNQGKQYAGKYNVSYNLSDLQNGIYNAILITADRKTAAKIILAK